MFVCAWAAVSFIRLSGERYPIDATRLPVPWVPMGIAVGVLYFRGANRWPGVFAGAAFAAWICTPKPSNSTAARRVWCSATI
jgi:hypothetical protein